MIPTIISVISLVVLIIVAKTFFDLVNALGELIVRFVEVNTEHFKNQKHLIEKANNLATNLKSIHKTPDNIKTQTRNLDVEITKLRDTIKQLEMTDEYVKSQKQLLDKISIISNNIKDIQISSKKNRQ